MDLNKPTMLAEVMASHRSMSSPPRHLSDRGKNNGVISDLFPPWRRRSNNGIRKGEGKWREEERAIEVPNHEGKAKRRWTFATVQEEASGERTVATEVTH